MARLRRASDVRPIACARGARRGEASRNRNQQMSRPQSARKPKPCNDSAYCTFKSALNFSGLVSAAPSQRPAVSPRSPYVAEYPATGRRAGRALVAYLRWPYSTCHLNSPIMRAAACGAPVRDLLNTRGARVCAIGGKPNLS